MSKSTYNAPIVTMPEITVFSVDPKTNKPYATIDYAEALAYTHINRYAKNLLKAIDPEDLKQELMLKLCVAKYDPVKSAPNTFMILCFKSHCARVWEREFQVRDRNKETSDFVLYDQDGESVMATEHIAIDHRTPEVYFSAQQEANTCLASNTLPKGYRRHSDHERLGGRKWPKSNGGSKQCHKCTEFKPVTEFYKRTRAGDGISSNCKTCKKAYEASKKLK